MRTIKKCSYNAATAFKHEILKSVEHLYVSMLLLRRNLSSYINDKLFCFSCINIFWWIQLVHLCCFVRKFIWIACKYSRKVFLSVFQPFFAWIAINWFHCSRYFSCIAIHSLHCWTIKKVRARMITWLADWSIVIFIRHIL